MVPEATLEDTEHGLLPGGDGWFVLNAREAPWMDRAGRARDCRKFALLRGCVHRARMFVLAVVAAITLVVLDVQELTRRRR